MEECLLMATEGGQYRKGPDSARRTVTGAGRSQGWPFVFCTCQQALLQVSHHYVMHQHPTNYGQKSYSARTMKVLYD